MPRTTLPERFFVLHRPDEVDCFLNRFEWSVVFKAGSGDKTVQAWLVVQRILEPREDVPVGFVMLPHDRPASERVRERTGIEHRSPQVILLQADEPRLHLNEFQITPERLGPQLREHLPATPGPRVVNEDVVSLEPYRALLASFVSGELPQERFEWAYLDRLRKEAVWRDAESFDVLNSLFENSHGRDVQSARIIAFEFQGRLAGRIEPLAVRARRQLGRLAAAGR